MLEIAIMIEGQNGLTWPRWQNIVRAVEDLGFTGLYRSDHFTNAGPPDKESLELWVSLTWLAANTGRIEFGPLVTPFSFRHPAFTARMAAAVDDLSHGRLTLGLGAGWQAREHDMFGFDLLGPSKRFERFEEGVDVTTRLLRSEGPVTHAGKYYRLNEAVILPRPGRSGGPRILIGGNGLKRTLHLAARYADEWNGNFLPPEAFERANRRLDQLLEQAGRPAEDVRRSMMTGCVFGRTQAALKKKLEARGRPAEQLREGGVLVGTPDAVREGLEVLERRGLQRIMLQWLDLDDLDGLAGLAEAVLSR